MNYYSSSQEQSQDEAKALRIQIERIQHEAELREELIQTLEQENSRLRV